MNNENRLQFLHCNQLFRSVDEIKNYVGTQDKFGDVPALFAEPTVFKYSDGVTTSDDNPNLVLAIGSNGDGTKKSVNNTFFIDISTVENKIASLSSFTNSESAELHDLEQLVKIVREDSIINLATSNSVEFVEISNNESGKTYTANVKICEKADNIIELNDTDGIYAKADLTYNQSSNTLSFTNSKGTTTIPLTQNQFFVSGYYSNQSDEIVLEFTGTTGYNEIRIPAKGLIEEWTVDNTGHNVRLVKVVNTGTVDDKLSADVNIAQVDHNILKSTIDGAGLYVNGSADNLYYDITHSTIKDKIESVINDNSLESARAQAEEIALSGAIHSETDRAKDVENAITNQVTNNYNSALTKTQIETDNRILDVKRVEDLALNAISAETEQRKSAILTEVSDRNTAISESESRSSALVLNETNRAKDVENSISASTLNIINSINNTNTEIDNINTSLTQSINSEILRATSAEQALDDKIKENKVTVFDSKTINFTTVTTSNGTSVSGDVNIADIPSSNILRIGESGLYANPANLQYNPLTNELTFIDENGKEIKWTLAGTQVISSSTYIEGSRVLRLIFGNGSSVDIPLNGLIEEWITANSDTIALSKTYDSVQGKDILTATAKISSNSSNALTTSGNGLYVNNGASNFIYQDGSSNGITIQSAITDLNRRLDSTNDTLSQDANKLSELSGKSITSITKNDSDTIELTITGDNNTKNIVANAKIALGETNAVKNENGLYVSNRADKLFIADGTSTIQNKLNSVDNQIENSFQIISAVSDDLETKIDNINTSLTQSIHSETDRATTAENAITNQVTNNYNSALTKTQIETDNRILDVKRVEDLALNAITSEATKRTNEIALLSGVTTSLSAISHTHTNKAVIDKLNDNQLTWIDILKDKISYDSTNNAIKFNTNLYSLSGISAYGFNNNNYNPDVDLSGYYKKNETSSKTEISNAISIVQASIPTGLSVDLSNYYTKNQTSGTTELSTKFFNYYTKTEVNDSINGVNTAIRGEINGINNAITAETKHRTDNDAYISGVCTGLSSSLSTETANRVNGDSSLNNTITAETASRVNGDTNNHNAITAETASRTTAINTEISDRNTAISESESRSSALVLNETDRAKDVENAITNQVVNNYNSALTKTQIETDNRILDVKRVEDLALNAISAETEQRKTAIITEVSDRNTAISESESRSSALVLSETDRATTAENAITNQVTNNYNSALTKTQIETDNRILDVKRVKDLTLNAISAETEQRKTAIITEVSDRNTAISESESRSSALVLNETDRAKDVENSISASTLNSINNTNTKIDNVNSSLTQSIHSETDRAATAELTLDKKFNENFLLAKATIDNIELSTIKNKGIFTSVSSLETTVPSPNVGDWAGVGTAFPVKLYVCNTAGTWVDSGSTWNGGDINLSNYVTNTTFSGLVGTTNNIISEVGISDYEEYNPYITYETGAIRTYQGKLYKCISDIISPEQFNNSNWAETSVNEIITNSLSKKLDSSKINVLSEDEYTALTTKEEGKIYFIYS